MFCPKCGTRIADKAVYCHACREKVDTEKLNKSINKKIKAEKRRQRIIETYKYMYSEMIVAQVVGLMTILVPSLDFEWLSNGISVLAMGGHFMDLQYLKALGIKGHWKWWGCFCTPVYLFIRSKKLNEKPYAGIISLVLLVLSVFSIVSFLVLELQFNR